MSNTSEAPVGRKGDKGFHTTFCAMCQHETWHYNQSCCDHSLWPRPHSLGGRPVESDNDDKPTAQRGLLVPAGNVRVRRLCGHLTVRSERYLCDNCRAALRGSNCFACGGPARPLAACLCQQSYLLTTDDQGKEKVTVPCNYCATPEEVWDLAPCLAGRWGKVERVVGYDRDGTPITQSRTVLFTKRLPCVCKRCRGLYDELQRLTRRGHVAFLPL